MTRSPAKRRRAAATPAAPTAPRSTRRTVVAKLAAFLGLLPAIWAFCWLEEQPWIGWGLAWLLPSDGAQIATAITLDVLLVAGLVLGGRRRPFPPLLAGALGALAITMYCIAPVLGGRGGGLEPAALHHVPHLLWTLYASYAANVLLVFAVGGWTDRRARPPRRLRGGRVAMRDLRFPSAAPPWSTAQRWGAGALAAVLPVAVVTGLVVLGRHAGNPLYPPAVPRLVTVDALAGTSLQPRVSTAELREFNAMAVALTASQLTDGEAHERYWEVAAGAEDPAGGRFDVFVSITELAADADLERAGAPIAGDTTPRVGDGWVTAFKQDDSAAVLDGRYLLVLRIGGLDEDLGGAERLQQVAPELTADRRAALVAATRPEA